MNSAALFSFSHSVSVCHLLVKFVPPGGQRRPLEVDFSLQFDVRVEKEKTTMKPDAHFRHSVVQSWATQRTFLRFILLLLDFIAQPLHINTPLVNFLELVNFCIDVLGIILIHQVSTRNKVSRTPRTSSSSAVSISRIRFSLDKTKFIFSSLTSPKALHEASTCLQKSRGLKAVRYDGKKETWANHAQGRFSLPELRPFHKASSSLP